MEAIIKGLGPLMVIVWIILAILIILAPVYIYQIRNQLISVNKKLATLIKILNSQVSFNVSNVGGPTALDKSTGLEAGMIICDWCKNPFPETDKAFMGGNTLCPDCYQSKVPTSFKS